VDARAQESERRQSMREPEEQTQGLGHEPEEQVQGLGAELEETGLPRSGHPRIATRELVAVAVGGAAGACARVAIATGWPAPPGAWPWATFSVNVLGAFLLGLIVAALRRHGRLSVTIYRLTGSGFCGALTTFSTMQVELLRMLQTGHPALAASYLAASVLAGYIAVSLAPPLLARAFAAGEPATEQA